MLFSKRSDTPKKIINALLMGDKTLTELSNEVEISKQALLKHLSQLEDQGFIQSKSSPGNSVQKAYSLTSNTMLLSISKDGYAISCSNPGFLDEEHPLLAQVSQPEFREELRKYLERIKKIQTGAAVVLYGSVAKGEAKRESDIDLSLVKSAWKKKEQEELRDIVSDLAVEGSLPHSLSLNFQTYGNLKSPTNDIQREILEDGILLYSGASETGEDLWQILKRYKSI